MMSVMSSTNVGHVVSPPEWGSSAAGEEKAASSSSEFGSSRSLGFNTVAFSEEAARSGGDGSDETRFYCNLSDSRALDLGNAGFSGSGGENQPSSSVCRLHGSSKNSSSQSGKLEHRKNCSSSEDYDSMLSAFDRFAAEGNDDAVGYGFKIGDMVWGKVKSHPWWPGIIYNEGFASPSVRKGKHESHHVLVAFFGDSSYGWFDPEGLIPLEDSFAEKAKQTTSRSFLKAVEEAGDEIARRSSLGLACRCRNEFNLWPSTLEGYFVVDVGDPEPAVYSSGLIRKAQHNFRPRDMVSFLHEVALQPMNDNYYVDFIKQKAVALALRKAFFEEFDETYAQAFGSQTSRPSRPAAPGVVDPSKAPLSGRLVIAEALAKGKVYVKPSNTKGQGEDKYIFKRREESIQMKSKKVSSSKVGHSPRPHLLDRMHQAPKSYSVDGQHQSVSQQASIVIKPSESSRKPVESGTKKVKLQKRPTSTAEDAIRVKKKKKGMSSEIDGELRELPVPPSESTVAAKNVSVIPVHVQPTGNNDLEDKINTAVGLSSSSQSYQDGDFAKIELQMLVTDLRVLALNPFHGEHKSCPAVIKEVFLKFRSLVYQKSLVLVPPAVSEAREGNPSRLPVPALGVGPTAKTNHKIVKPSVRLDDPTKSGKKRGPSDRPEDVQKKKFDLLLGVKRKNVDDSFDRKKMDDSKSSTIEKKVLQRSADHQHGDVKDNAVRFMPPTLPKAVKQESSKQTGQMARAASPTMVVMKFPAGAALPSIPQLKARFARFGPLDQSGTRVFWKSYTCRLVYQHKIDALAALKFAVGSKLFGNANVRCFLREVEGEGADPEPVKPQKEDTSHVASQTRESGGEQRIVAKVAASQPQSPAQLKSCLKKPSGDEGGNGGSRGARVKFILGEGEKGDSEVPSNQNKKNNVGSASTIHSSSKILPKMNSHSSNTFAPPPNPTLPFKHLSVSLPCSEQGGRPVPSATPANDISQQMLNLLMRCSDVIDNLSAAFGHVPYHPL